MVEEIYLNDILRFDQRYRANFINSLTGFKSVCLIGTKNKEEQTNLAIFNSLVHLGAHPPLIGFITRPNSVERHTLDNILETSEYTINHITQDTYLRAHQTSARYPKEISEFSVTNLTEEFKSGYYAPFVKESSIKMYVTFQQKIDIELNNTSLIIGKIKWVSLPKNCVYSDGFVDIEKAGTITCSGLDSYHVTHKIARLSYAKPDKELQEVINDAL